MRPEELQIITELGHGTNGGASRLDGVPLLDRNCRGNPLNSINLGLVHAIEELAGVRGESFYVTTLPLGTERVKGQGAFARAAQPREDDEFAYRQIQIEVF